jgi:hypothetical protein
MKTVTPVKVMADLMLIETGDDGASKLIKFDGLLPLTITIEDGMLTIGTHHGPDMWRKGLTYQETAELKDLMNEGG